MSFDLSRIVLSKSDLRRRVRLPVTLTTKLAEFIGIMIGDGNLAHYPRWDDGILTSVRRAIRISCNAQEEEYILHIQKMFKRLFNLSLKYVRDTRSNAVLLIAHSKGVYEFLNSICELPINRKENVRVPRIILGAGVA